MTFFSLPGHSSLFMLPILIVSLPISVALFCLLMGWACIDAAIRELDPADSQSE